MKNLKKKIVCLIFALIFVCGLFVSAYQIFKHLNEYRQGEDFYSELDSAVKVTETKESTTDELHKYNSPSKEKETVNLPKVDFDVLDDISSDIFGWIYFDGTKIDYPVVKCKDNSYYLNRLFNGEINSCGSIFLDADNNENLTDKNNIIYGHHMKNGTMFADITKYKDQAYYDGHKEAFLLTPDKNYKIELFSGYVADPNDNAWTINFKNDDEFMKWTNQLIEKSCFKSDVSPKSSDRIVTFSTCSYEFSDARFVLHGVLINL